jgi:hypothetical protein
MHSSLQHPLRPLTAAAVAASLPGCCRLWQLRHVRNDRWRGQLLEHHRSKQHEQSHDKPEL